MREEEKNIADYYVPNLFRSSFNIMKRKPYLIYFLKRALSMTHLQLEGRKQMLFLKKMVTNFGPHSPTVSARQGTRKRARGPPVPGGWDLT